ncbi:hypothetical protein JNW90_13760 [Micromonospora sp. STR1s_5]|nr:hypothetical protein [Micromonospora sp. STR1s_5]
MVREVSAVLAICIIAASFSGCLDTDDGTTAGFKACLDKGDQQGLSKDAVRRYCTDKHSRPVDASLVEGHGSYQYFESGKWWYFHALFKNKSKDEIITAVRFTIQSRGNTIVDQVGCEESWSNPGSEFGCSLSHGQLKLIPKDQGEADPANWSWSVTEVRAIRIKL